MPFLSSTDLLKIVFYFSVDFYSDDQFVHKEQISNTNIGFNEQESKKALTKMFPLIVKWEILYRVCVSF